MTAALAAFLDELYADGLVHDAAQTDRLNKRRNLEPATAALLSLIIRMIGAHRVVEIGAGNGFSTIWLAEALGDSGGTVVSVDSGSIDAALVNIGRVSAIQPDVAERIELRHEDGGNFLKRLSDGSIDVLFLDAERPEYESWWPHPIRILQHGGVLAVDNVLSHPDEVRSFLQLLSLERSLVGETIAVGKGLHLAWKKR
jgi:predicted O-methyltransferase YrrM